MRLTKNEKKTLKLLLENAKISDSYIANKLRISSQAVGKIRKKLEATVINSYTLNINYSKLGIQTFAIALAKLTPEGLDTGELEVEEKLLANPHIIQVYRLPSSSPTHIILYGFRDVSEFDEFFHSYKQKQELHNFIENQDLFTFSHNSLLKNSPVQLFNKVIEELGTGPVKMKFRESEDFNRGLEDEEY